MIRRSSWRALACVLLLGISICGCAACAKNACQRARERLHACQMPEATFNFDGDCTGERQRAMECIAAASCEELRRGGLVRCLGGAK